MLKNWSSRIWLVFALPALGFAQDFPRVETFLGYTYMRANSATNVPAFSANGGSGQLVLNFNKWVGVVGDFGGVHNGNIGGVKLDSTIVNFLFGPRISLRHSRVTPYFNVLFGGVYATTSGTVTPVAGNLPASTATNGTVTGAAAQTAFAMTTGGGLDIKINRHLSFRPIGLDYLMTRLQNFRSAEDHNQHNLRYTAGLNFTFGGEAPTPPPPPPPPPMHACWDGSSLPVGTPCPKRNMDLRLSTSQAEVCPGGTITLSPSGPIPDGATYQWTIDGQPISQGNNLDFGASGRTPGTYKVGLTVAANEYNDAAAAGTVTVRDYGDISGNIEVVPPEIWAGDKATLSLRISPGKCAPKLNDPRFTAAEGSISGAIFDSTDVQFDPGSNSEQRKSVPVVAHLTGDKEGTVQAAVIVKKAAVVLAKRLPDIVFPKGNARVNNCGKRVLLEDLRAMLERDPSGKVVLVGHVSESEAGKTGLDQQRALNAAAVISAGQGICYSFAPAQILVGTVGAADNGVDYQSNFCGSTQELPGSTVKESENDSKLRRVEVWFVPANGAVPASTATYTAAASLAVSSLGCPK